ncbi:hypothetical protein [Streptomyces griseosporeus]|uniref:hypothetical protein n=1 Tax=Streptomyces griseosporeus TaxID=1910 RepID=UPI003700C90F
MRSGRRFLVASTDDADHVALPPLRLDWIKRYQRVMDFIDPPHSAVVRLSGQAVHLLARGVVLTSVAADA